MIFTDKEVNDQFYKDGYCKISLLDEEEVALLKEFAYQNLDLAELKNPDFGIYISVAESLDKRHKIRDYIQEIAVPKLDKHLVNHRINDGSFLIKVPDGTTYTMPHQDWTFVDDKTDDASANVWISLHDLDENQGTLGFIKGSHRFLNFPIGTPKPHVQTPIMGKEKAIFEHLTFVPVKAGDALIFNNKLIHAALPNSGDFIRIAAGIGITPKTSDLFHYFLNPQNQSELLKLKASEEFFINYNSQELLECFDRGQIPNYTSIVDTIPDYTKEYPNEEEIIRSCLNFGNMKNGYQLDLQKHFSKNQTPRSAPITKKFDSLESSEKRTFYEKYSLPNIYKEISGRLYKILK